MAFGLNKEARLVALRKEREVAKRAAVLRLDPEFPFDPVGFDPVFFGVESSEANPYDKDS